MLGFYGHFLENKKGVGLASYPKGTEGSG